MSGLRCLHVSSIQELRDNASSWDDLWWRSDVATPNVRAEILAQWIEQFNPHGFRALVVADQQRWIAALPLISRRVGGVMPMGGLPSNPWSPCGELLLDTTADAEAALDLLLAAATPLTWQVLWLNDVPLEAPHWQTFLQACQRAGIPTCCHERFRSGRVEIGQDWDAYQRRLPKNHRQAMQRALRRLAGQGELHCEMHSRLPPSDVEPWLRAAFEIEDRSWKGAAGTSVLRTPGMLQFFLRNATQLAQYGHLETATLRLDGRMLAFVYGFSAKGVYFAHKIGYDPQFAAFSPGQLLFHHVLEQLHTGDCPNFRGGDSPNLHGEVRENGTVPFERPQWLDFMGPLGQSLSRWRPESYSVGQLLLAPPRRPLGRAAMYAYEHWWRPLRDRKTVAATQRPDLAAAHAD